MFSSPVLRLVLPLHGDLECITRSRANQPGTSMPWIQKGEQPSREIRDPVSTQSGTSTSGLHMLVCVRRWIISIRTPSEGGHDDLVWGHTEHSPAPSYPVCLGSGVAAIDPLARNPPLQRPSR